MKKGIYIIFSIMFFIFSGVSIISAWGATNNANTSFDVFANSVLNLIKNENIENYSNKVFDLQQDLLQVDNSLMVELEQFKNKTNSEVTVNNNLIEIKYNEETLLLGNNKLVVNGEEQIVTNNCLKTINNKIYFDVDVVSRYLGFEVTETSNKLILTSAYKTKRVIVKSYKELDSQNAVKKVEGYNGLHFFEYSTIDDCKNAYNYYLQQDVEWVEVDSYYSIFEDVESNKNSSYLNSNEYKKTASVVLGKNDSFSYSSWGAQAMGVESYSNYLLNNGGALNEVIVAVLDTGLDSDHSWFNGRVKPGGKNFSTSTSSTSFEYEDVNGHGTHVAGTIVDLTLNNVKILPIKVLSDAGTGLTTNIVLGLEYVVGLKNKTQIAQGATRIDNSYTNIVAMNLSFGGTGSTVNGTNHSKYNNILTSARSANILPVAAAGNDGIDCVNTSPANVACAITVSAVGKAGNNGFFRPYWSNFGDYVDVCAPGEKIESAKVGGGTVSLDGTSMAAPHVAGVVALLYSGGNSISQIEQILTRKSLDLGTTGKDAYYGNGFCYIEYAYANLLTDVVNFNTTAITGGVNLTLSCTTPNGLIKYTTNGENPNLDSNSYSSAISLNKTTLVKARIFVTNGDDIISYSNEFCKEIIINSEDVEDAFEVRDGELINYKGVFKEVSVPSITSKGQVITCIGERAFMESNPTKVTLDEGIKTISKFAFYGCYNLQEVVASGVTDIGRYAFFYCENLQYLTNTQFPALKNIDKYSFANCTNLQSINLNNVTLVDYYAFYMEKVPQSLTSVTLPNVKTVGDYAFYNVEKLKQVSLPKVEIIGSKSFQDCDITSLSLPEAKYLGNQCFDSNSKLTSVNIPNVLQIGSQCFYNCISLKSVIAPLLEQIASLAFGRTALTQINMPQLESVGVQAFYFCNELSSIYVPKLREIKVEAFYNCGKLTEINLPSIESIEKEAFYNLTNVESVTLSPSLKYMSFCAFNNFSDDCMFYIYASTPAKAFVLGDSRIKYEELDEHKSLFKYDVIKGREVYIKGINNNLIDNMIEIIIPSFIESLPVTKICSEAFKDCSLVRNLQLTNLKEIESGAFENCLNLVEINLPKIETIGARAFYGCSSLNKVDIENVSVIKEYAFYNCNQLTQVKLGSNISALGTKSLGYVNNSVQSTFNLIGYNGVASSYATNNGISKFHNIYSDLSGFYYGFYNNNGNEEIYISLVNGYTEGGVIVPETIDSVRVTKIGDNAFEDCVLITDVCLPSSVTTIGCEAFRNCINLKNINLNYVTTLEESCFERCENLQSVTINNVTEIPNSAFRLCYSLETINMPEVVTICDYAFYGCSGLINVISPKLQVIQSYGFAQCYKLKNINLSNVKILGRKETSAQGNVTIIGSVFDSCYELGEFVYLLNIEEIGDQIFVDSGVKYVVIGRNFNAYSSGLLTPSISRSIVIYGYSGSFAQTYATRNGNEFREIPEFKIINNIEQVKTCSEFEVCYVSVSATGLGLTYKWYNALTLQEIEGETEEDLYVDTSRTGTFKYYCIITSWDGETLTSANFVINVMPAYEINIICSDRGIVTPSVSGKIRYNTNVTLFITVNEGCFVKRIIVDGVSLTQEQINNALLNGYTFRNVVNDHAFEVEFGINYYTITVACGENGVVSSLTAEVEHGSYYTFYFTANSGYHVSDVKVDGISVTAASSYTFNNVKQNHSLQVEFSENKYAINVFHNSFGSLKCDSSLDNIDEGDNRTFTILVEEGYYVKSVKYNNTELEIEDNTFTISNINSDIVIEVDFKKIDNEEENILLPQRDEDVLVLVGIAVCFVIVIVGLPMFLFRKKNH